MYNLTVNRGGSNINLLKTWFRDSDGAIRLTHWANIFGISKSQNLRRPNMRTLWVLYGWVSISWGSEYFVFRNRMKKELWALTRCSKLHKRRKFDTNKSIKRSVLFDKIWIWQTNKNALILVRSNRGYTET